MFMKLFPTVAFVRSFGMPMLLKACLLFLFFFGGGGEEKPLQLAIGLHTLFLAYISAGKPLLDYPNMGYSLTQASMVSFVESLHCPSLF